MIVGVLKEIKEEEYRVAMTPAGVEQMRGRGHTVLVETGAGEGSGFDNDGYDRAGAEIVGHPSVIYERAEMIVHVKEPMPGEYEWIRKDQILFTFLHLAASQGLTRALLKSGAVSIAYETIETAGGRLPLLTPMSEIAGRMSIQEGAKYLEKPFGGRGVLLGGVPGVNPATVLIIGAGAAGSNAARMAGGLGARVYLLDLKLERLRYLADVMPPNCFMLKSSPQTIRDLAREADLVVGAVLITGAKAPCLIDRETTKLMKSGAVMVDVAIDQGGCFEMSRPTTHTSPTFTVEEVVYYCVANMPGAVSRTATLALTNATLPYVLEIADKGWEQAARENKEIARGVNTVRGELTCKAVAEAFDWTHTPLRLSPERKGMKP